LNELNGIFFPNTYIGDLYLKKIFIFFDQLTICQPWFRDDPSPEAVSSVKIFHPPVSLKPEVDFKSLLSEYQFWISRNRDKSTSSFIKASEGENLSENTSWEIRQMLGRAVLDSSDSRKNQSLKWHFILHLAGEFERNRGEAEKIFNQIKQQKSPLDEAIEEGGAIQNTLKTLTQFGTNHFINESQLTRIFEAWFGLFGENLQPDGLLVTFDRNIMNHAATVYEDSLDEQRDLVLPEVSLNMPDMSSLTMEELVKIKDTYKNSRQELSILIRRLQKGHDSHKDNDIAGLAKKVEKSFHTNAAHDRISVTIKSLPAVEKNKNSANRTMLPDLSGKIIILFDDINPAIK